MKVTPHDFTHKVTKGEALYAPDTVIDTAFTLRTRFFVSHSIATKGNIEYAKRQAETSILRGLYSELRTEFEELKFEVLKALNRSDLIEGTIFKRFDNINALLKCEV